jgi:hypothetical protein
MFPVTKCASYLLGVLVIISTSGSSNTRAVLGTRFDPRSIQSTSTVDNGRGSYIIIKARKGHASHMVEINKKPTTFLRLSNNFLPSSIPITMEEKSSSRRIISAASLATSDPVIPIETPISAFLIAGESLTPSPVTATI